MKTTLEHQAEKQVPFLRVAQSRHDNASATLKGATWARLCATAGAVVWAALAVLARIGVARIGAIELLLLFAPLVIVPLGMELGRVVGGSGRFEDWARRLQPGGVLLAVVAMILPLGWKAGLLALGWLCVCVLMAVGGIVGLVQAWRFDAGAGARVTFGTLVPLKIAQIDLAVGGAWFVASRLGIRPLGIQEPIGLLTAVHFHYAGFASATIAAATLAFAQSRGTQRWLRFVMPVVVGMPFVVAVGFVVSPALKMVAALLFSASIAVLAIAVRGCGRAAEHRTARLLLQVAAAAVFAGMVLSGIYAVVDFMGSEVLTIPQMARTHGILNAFGFCLLGLLGWLVECGQKN